MALVQRFISDESGAILSAELVIVATVLVIGMIVGLSSIQSAVVAEAQDVSAALSGLNQSYGLTGFRGCWKRGGLLTAWNCGSSYIDVREAVCGVEGAATEEIVRTPQVQVAPVAPAAVPATTPEPAVVAPAVAPPVVCPPASPTVELPPAFTPDFAPAPCDPPASALPVAPLPAAPCCPTEGHFVPGQVLPNLPPAEIPAGPVPQALPSV